MLKHEMCRAHDLLRPQLSPDSTEKGQRASVPELLGALSSPIADSPLLQQP